MIEVSTAHPVPLEHQQYLLNNTLLGTTLITIGVKCWIVIPNHFPYFNSTTIVIVFGATNEIYLMLGYSDVGFHLRIRLLTRSELHKQQFDEWMT